MALQMDSEQVVGQGDLIKSHAEEVTNLHQWLKDVVNNQLPAMWQGRGYEGFQSRVEEMAPSFEAMRQLIVDIGDGVIKNATEYSEFDEAVRTANLG